MDDITGLLVGGGAAAVNAGRLARLRGQRMRLEELIDEVRSAAALFRTGDSSDGAAGADAAGGGTWRSRAGQAYAARRQELQSELDRSVSLVDDALIAVEWAISELRAAE